jgi:septation ring formation regulator EzrA
MPGAGGGIASLSSYWPIISAVAAVIGSYAVASYRIRSAATEIDKIKTKLAAVERGYLVNEFNYVTTRNCQNAHENLCKKIEDIKSLVTALAERESRIENELAAIARELELARGGQARDRRRS